MKSPSLRYTSIRIYVCLILLLVLGRANGQWSEIWHFGNTASNPGLSLDFTGGTPPIPGCPSAMSAHEGTASFTRADTTVIYTNGQTVWNYNHDALTNGTGLNGDWSSAMSSIIIPVPGNSELFYVFTTGSTADVNNGEGCGACSPRYSIVDMSNHTGGIDGAITTKDAALPGFGGASASTEKVHVVNNPTGGYWIVVGRNNGTNDQLLVYEMTFTGALSLAGTYATGFDNMNSTSMLKISPVGDKIAVTAASDCRVYDFDVNTGVIDVSSLQTLGVGATYGIEFSPDGSLVYTTGGPWGGTVEVTRLSDGSTRSLGGSGYALMLGPDNTIYMADEGGNHVDAILSTNVNNYVATALTASYVSWGGTGCTLGSGVWRGLDLHAPQPCDTFSVYTDPVSPIDTCPGALPIEVIGLVTDPSLSGLSYVWYQDSIGGTIVQTDSAYTVPAEGTYVIEVSHSSICTRYDTVEINTSIDLGSDIQLCNPTEGVIDAGYASLATNYTWYQNDVLLGANQGNQTLTVNVAGTYRVVVATAGCGTIEDTIIVTLASDAAVPTNDTICAPGTANLSVSGSGTYDWYSDSTQTNLVAGSSTTHNPAYAGTYSNGVIDTFWVVDNSAGSSTVLTAVPSSTGHPRDYAGEFVALSQFTLETVQIRVNSGVIAGEQGVYTIQLYNVSNGAVVATDTYNHNSNSLMTHTMTFNYTIPAVDVGDSYELRVIGYSFNGYMDNRLRYSSQTLNDGVINVTDDGAFFNWVYSYGSSCGQTPVYVVNYCVPSCTTPDVDDITNADSCDQYTLPEITGSDLSGNEAYYTGPFGTGTSYDQGDVITSDQLPLYIYDSSGVGCSDQEEFNIDIHNTPDPDSLANVAICDEYTLPALTIGTYYDATGGPGGAGSTMSAGDVLTIDQTVYVYAESGTTPNCTDEEFFTIDIHTTPDPDSLANVAICDEYTLPALTVGTYYNATGGPGGTGSTMSAGDILTTDQTVYAYAESGTTPNCIDEEFFTVDIHNTPDPDSLANVAICDEYTLPALTVGTYYDATGGPGGAGSTMSAGDVLTTDQTVYIYAESGTTPNCTDEEFFTVDIHATPVIVTQNDTTNCDSIQLPNIGIGNYYTATNQGGTDLGTGGLYVTSDQTVYIYAESGTTPNCTIEDTFDITLSPIVLPGDITPDLDSICNGGSVQFDLTGSTLASLGHTVSWWEGTSANGVYAQIGVGVTDEDTVFTASYTNATTEPDTMWVYSMTVAACDTAYSDTVEVIIHPEPVGGTLLGSDICPGDSTWIVLTGYAGDSIRWESSAAGSGVWNSLPFTIDSIRVGPSADSTYRAIIKYSNGVCLEDTSTEQTISLSTAAIISGQWVDADKTVEYCTGFGATDSLDGAANGTALWQEYDGTDWVNYSGSETNDSTETFEFTNTGLVIDTHFVRVRYTTTCDTTYSDTLTVIVHPEPVGGAVSSAIICPNGFTTLLLSGYQGDSILWQVADSGTGVWIDQGLVTADTIQLSPVGNVEVRAVVLYSSGLCIGDTSSIGTIVIDNGAATAGLISGPDTLCVDTPDYLVLTGNNGSIQWQDSTAGVWSDLVGENNDSLTVQFASDLDPDKFYRVIVSNGSCADTTNYSFYVKTCCVAPTTASIINDGPVCQGDTILAVVTTDAPALYEFTWYSVSTGLLLSGVDEDSLTFVSSDSVYVRINQPGDTSCNVYSDTVLIDVRDTAAAGLISILPDSICEGDLSTVWLSTYFGSIIWQDSSVAGSWTNMASSNDSIDVSPLAVNSPISYRAILENGGICYDTSSTVELTVLPLTTMGAITPVLDTLCSGDSVNVSLSAASGGLTWYQNTGSGWLVISGESGLDMWVLPNVTTEYRAIVDNGVCGDTSDISTIVVFPTADVFVAINGPSSGCEGDDLDYSISFLQGEGSNPEINWYVDGAVEQVGGLDFTIDSAHIGNFPVMIEVISDSVCAMPVPQYDTIDVTVEETIVPTVSLLLRDGQNGCSGDQYAFEAIASPFDSTGNYIWYVNGVPSPQSGIGESEFTSNALSNADEITIEFYPDYTCVTTAFAAEGPFEIVIGDPAVAGEPRIDSSETCYGEEQVARLTNYVGNIQWLWSEDQTNWNVFTADPDQDSIFVSASSLGIHDMLGLDTVYVTANVYNSPECDTVQANVVALIEFPPLDGEAEVHRDCENMEISLTHQENSSLTLFSIWFESEDGASWTANGDDPVTMEGLDISNMYYLAEFTNDIGCLGYDSVFVEECPLPDVDVSNALTPNGSSGQNDVFWIGNIEYYPNNQLWIYNRWGNLVYISKGYDNIDTAWDGTRMDNEMPAAVYYYILDLNDGSQPMTGTITIVR